MSQRKINKHTMNEVGAESLDRRSFLKRTGSTATALGLVSLAPATFASALTSPNTDFSYSDIQGPDRVLRLANAHTWEKVDVTYWSDGAYNEDALAEINHLMRDHRANKSTQMDRKVIDDLHRLYKLMDTSERVHILSGFRTPETNAKLRKRSNGVAKYSLHMEGRAIDLNIPGKTAKQINDAALSMKTGGVGYYPAAGFVHIDSGAVRSWNQG